EEAEEVPSDGDVDEEDVEANGDDGDSDDEDMNPDEDNFDDDIDDIPPPGVGRGGRRRPLPRRVVRNRYLEGMPKSRTVDGVEEEYDSYDDDDDHEDEEIAEVALLAPQHELLVDRYNRPIIMPY
ncbi:hypothetical protein L195_g059323, partial [Trifolium pratense]